MTANKSKSERITASQIKTLSSPAAEKHTGLEPVGKEGGKMKMSKDHFETLRTGLLDTLAGLNVKPSDVCGQREQWNVLHLARQNGRVNLLELYRDYNDQHIETAMREIFQ